MHTPIPDGMRVRIARTFHFSAGHHLSASPGDPDGLDPSHKCTRPHGHNYTVEVVLEAPGQVLVGAGFVTEFGALAPFADYLKAEIDHRNLNEVVTVEPTSELLAAHFAQWLTDNLVDALPGRLVAVRVSETPSTWAECLLA